MAADLQQKQSPDRPSNACRPIPSSDAPHGLTAPGETSNRLIPPADIDVNDIVEETGEAWLYGFPQGSEKWHSGRKCAIGGSAIYAILGESRYATRTQALANILHSPELQLTEIILRGSVGESLIRDHVKKLLDLRNLREIGIAVHKKAPWMRASPDGIYETENGTGVLEIKVVSSKARREELNLSVDRYLNTGSSAGFRIFDEHRHQMHYTAGVIGAEEITYCILVWPAGQEGYMIIRQFPADTEIFKQVYLPTAAEAYQLAKRASIPYAPEGYKLSSIDKI
jgi:predicted phage-related endonuclease